MAHELISKVKAHNFFKLTETHFGFNFPKESNDNMRRLRQFLLNSAELINQTITQEKHSCQDLLQLCFSASPSNKF